MSDKSKFQKGAVIKLTHEAASYGALGGTLCQVTGVEPSGSGFLYSLQTCKGSHPFHGTLFPENLLNPVSALVVARLKVKGIID